MINTIKKLCKNKTPNRSNNSSEQLYFICNVTAWKTFRPPTLGAHNIAIVCTSVSCSSIIISSTVEEKVLAGYTSSQSQIYQLLRFLQLELGRKKFLIKTVKPGFPCVSVPNRVYPYKKNIALNLKSTNIKRGTWMFRFALFSPKKPLQIVWSWLFLVISVSYAYGYCCQTRNGTICYH